MNHQHRAGIPTECAGCGAQLDAHNITGICKECALIARNRRLSGAPADTANAVTHAEAIAQRRHDPRRHRDTGPLRHPVRLRQGTRTHRHRPVRMVHSEGEQMNRRQHPDRVRRPTPRRATGVHHPDIETAENTPGGNRRFFYGRDHA
jgi:hypothetical protein